MKDDLISRQAAIETVKKHYRVDNDLLEVIAYEIEALPSAQPDVSDTNVGKICEYYDLCRNGRDEKKLREELLSAQPGWIPCSERMPEEHEWIGTKKFGTTISNEVYVTFEAPNGERFAKHISFQNGKLSSVDEQRMKVWYKGAKPIAWCPLPDPWKGEQDNGAD